MNTTELREETQADRLLSADVLVVVGTEAQRKATEWEAVRDWVSQGQPTVAVDARLEGVESLTFADLDYFDEADDVFGREPSDGSRPDLDRDLHPTLLRLGEQQHLLEQLALPGNSNDIAERVAVASLRGLRVHRSPHAVGGRLIRASGLKPPAGKPEALAVMTSKRADYVVDAVRQLVAQTYRPLRIGITLHGEAASAEPVVRQLLDSTDVPHQVLIRDMSRPQGACLNDLVASMPGDVVLKIDDDDLYSPVYAEDMVSCLEYSGASVMGKASAFYRLHDGSRILMRGANYGPADHVVGSTITVKRRVWDEIRFPHRHERVDSSFLHGVKTVGFDIVSQHPWDFCVVRHDQNTWEATDDYFSAAGLRLAIDWSDMDTSTR